MTNPYAPPQAAVRDIVDPSIGTVPADRATRLGAAILDYIVFGVLVYTPLVFGIIFAGVTTTPERLSEDQGAGAAMVMGVGGLFALVGFIGWVTINVLSMRRSSQSIGKRVCGIKVVRSDGSRVSLSRLIWIRNVVNLIISIVPLYGLIDTLFIFGESRQCLHDKLADTIVVKA